MPTIEVQGSSGQTVVTLVDFVGDVYRELRYCCEIPVVVPGPFGKRYNDGPDARDTRVWVDFRRNDRYYLALIWNLFGTVCPRIRVRSNQILLGERFTLEISDSELEHILRQLELKVSVHSR